jgi:DNA-binding IclR family transcriptional regulator
LQSVLEHHSSPWARSLRVFHSAPDLHCTIGGAALFRPSENRKLEQSILGANYAASRKETLADLHKLKQARNAERARRRALEKDVFAEGVVAVEAIAARIVNKRPGQFIERVSDAATG